MSGPLGAMEPLATSFWAETVATFQQTVLHGSFVAAALIAVLAGLVSFASPCILPLVPGYFGYLGAMTSDRKDAGSTARLVSGVSLFVLGFALVFVSLGALAGSVGSLLIQHMRIINIVLGLLVILLGLAFLGVIPWFMGSRQLQVGKNTGVWSALLLGITFALSWTPCLGPILATLNVLALTEGSATRGGLLMVFYAFGLGLPFVVIALGYAKGSRTLKFLRTYRRQINLLGGTALVIIGVMLVSGLWTRVTTWLGSWVAQIPVVL